MPKLLTPKFPGLSIPGAERYLCVGKQPGMLLRGGNPHICSAPPQSAGVLRVTSGAALAPPGLWLWGCGGPQGCQGRLTSPNRVSWDSRDLRQRGKVGPGEHEPVPGSGSRCPALLMRDN